jgi:hypothetical protein
MTPMFEFKYCPGPGGFKSTLLTNVYTVVQCTEARFKGLITIRLTAGLGIDSTY